jgi:1,4-alpha-glucan branching enzyme
VLGERLSVLAQPKALEAAIAVLLLSPSPPLMFMGDEWGAHEPFPFFCDFKGELAEAVRNGRRMEFAAAYASHQGEVPDPLSNETLRLAALDWKALSLPAHGARLDLVRRLIATRKAFIVPLLSTLAPGQSQAEFSAAVLNTRWAFRSGEVLSVLANLSDRPWPRPDDFGSGTPVWGGPPPPQLAPWAVHAEIRNA